MEDYCEVSFIMIYQARWAVISQVQRWVRNDGLGLIDTRDCGVLLQNPGSSAPKTRANTA